MLQDRKSFAGRIADSVRMCMYMVCGVRENKYKQPKFIENSAQDGLYYQLTALIDKGKINEAEDIMYERLNPEFNDDYYTMLCLYDYMNGLEDGFLRENNFSREEILDGIKEITHAHDMDGIYESIISELC
ncbi:MAG: hypothetical protein HDT13_11025 [Butyrivibrio sp.]|nr:hypothetical protein [Butyrivibrio sp.]